MSNYINHPNFHLALKKRNPVAEEIPFGPIWSRSPVNPVGVDPVGPDWRRIPVGHIRPGWSLKVSKKA